LLKQCPGEPLCDACLALACSVSLSEMRDVTAAIGRVPPFARTTGTCASCRRQTLTVARGVQAVDAKCAHCSRPIDPGEAVEVVETDRFHTYCWVRLLSAESVRSAKILSRRSWGLINKSRERMGLPPLEDPSPNDA